ncbi:TORTIFOLIA1-like protein 4 [Olea europaea var. sylvestris]|uniref:TORTIFOLIA1-like protein 4 n=1 Tax=Olea europaea var. sylvestris TaxID=158386 RepID=UPI000C1CF260|nr:TORTIFOLIA1-like protein 4 [Olea europaea var. sylvestris]
MAITKQPSGDIKTRVNSCLNKLSDRDTLSMATNELESIARNLSTESFGPFLNCLSATDSSDKSPVRRQCVRLLGILSASHGDALSPHLSRMLSSVFRRLRDPDSTVRSACVGAITSITTHVTKPPFSAILKPLVDALFHEQDQNSQIGASLCLAAAVGAAQEPDMAELKTLLQRLLKLVKSDCFRAKSALLVLIGSIVSVGAAKTKNLLNCLISTTVELLSSDDWATRKAAAEVLERLATAETNMLPEFKASCVATLDIRRFDKVKVVRETMNRALEMWRDVPAVYEEESTPKDSGSGERSPVRISTSPVNRGSMTPRVKKTLTSRSPTSSSSSPASNEKRAVKSENRITSKSSKVDFRKNFRSRVVPCNGNDDNALDMAADKANECNLGDQKEFEDISLIREQLVQIENQQSSLLELLQRFIGSSQKGMNSLEKRVNGLEKVLDEMSHDLAVSTRRTPSSDSSGNTCCLIPGAEFLSPKFWRKTEGQNSNARFFSSITEEGYEYRHIEAGNPKN